MAPPQQRPPRNTLAVVCFASSLAALFFLPFIGHLIGLVTGYLARAEIRRRPYPIRHDNMARDGLVLAWLGLIVWTVGVCLIIFWFIPAMKELFGVLADALLLRTRKN